MANLVVEIGNTAVKAVWTEEKTLGKTFRYQGEKAIDFILSLASKDIAEVMVLASSYVISEFNENRLRKVCGHLIILDKSHRSLVDKLNLPNYLSYDRVASILAIRHYFKDSPCTLVDFGTTLTVDFLDEKGEYLGGNISLGCRTRFKALNRYSKSLPMVNTPKDVMILGNSIDTSVESGVINGIKFEIGGYINKSPKNVIVFTGGDADYFVKRMKNSIFVIRNLVLMGLALIAEKYVEKID